MIWDAVEGCQHEWEHNTRKHSQDRGGQYGDGKQLTNVGTTNCEKGINESFCQLCGAWRGCLGLEPNPELYIKHMVQIFRELRRVLRNDGTLWLNMGDSYSGGARNDEGFNQRYHGKHYLSDKQGEMSRSRPKRTPAANMKPKDLCGIPWMLAFALRADGWWLRSAMPWVKRSAMPESVNDRPASALEYMFLLTKSSKYYFDMDAVRVEHAQPLRGKGEKDRVNWNTGGIVGRGRTGEYSNGKREYNPAGRNFRNTDLFFESLKEPYGMIFCGDEPVGIDCNPQAMKEAHFATFPEKLIEPCILAGTSEKGCCVECGAPWGGVVEKTKEYHRKPGYKANSPMARNKDNMTNFYPDMYNTISKTIGWKPSCECNAETTPCTVMDIFFGSGTTAIVAYKYGRKFIGIELSETYLKNIAVPRIEKATKQLKLFN